MSETYSDKFGLAAILFSALAFVVAMAWNDTATAILKRHIEARIAGLYGGKDGALFVYTPMVLYAVLVTAVAVGAAYLYDRRQSAQEDPNKSREDLARQLEELRAELRETRRAWLTAGERG